MNLTALLKGWLVENCGVEKSADDVAFQKAAAEALISGKLGAEKLIELQTEEDDRDASDIKSLISGFKDAIAEFRKDADTATKLADEKAADKAAAEKAAADKAAAELAAKDTTPSRMQKMLMSAGIRISDGSEEIDGEEKTFEIRVKDAVERYDSTKSNLSYPETTEKGKPHPRAGELVKSFDDSGRVLESTSERDMAIAGAYGKFIVNAAKLKSRSLAFQQLPEHDKNVLCWAMENEKWGGSSDGGDLADIKDRKLTLSEQKALIDDSTSGGLEAAPIVFDDQVIQTPLLNGELYPMVTTRPLDRGRRVEGVATGTVTSGWGGVDDTAISLFNTASYVTAFDTTIFRWEGAVRIGLDFLSDTPIDFGQHITAQYGERLLEDLDDVIAVGNGTTQPEGVMNKTGATSVAWGGTTSLGNYESLRFGVGKNEHKANVKSSACFIGTETSYQRATAIPVGASDARRLGGMDYDSYRWMQRPYKINESLANTQIAYAILARYRMYRRRGFTIRTSTEGDTLIRRNEMLMVAMARYGGQMERGAVIARTTTAPA